MAALHDVVQAGKVRYLGASSMFAWQFAQAQAVAPTPFCSMQNHYNLVYREEEREMIPLCLDQGVGVIPYSPLARGLLGGARRRGGAGGTVRSASDPLAQAMYEDADFDVVDEVCALARERGRSPAEIALAWLLHRPAVSSVVVGATKVAHIAEAANSVNIQLTGPEMARLEAPYRPHRVLGHS
jgi:aryl-alcohol dehydrogenase-like predicted oxidoreductase